MHPYNKKEGRQQFWSLPGPGCLVARQEKCIVRAYFRVSGRRYGCNQAATAVHDDHMTKRGKNTHITSRKTPEDMCKTQAGPTIAIRPCLGGWVVGFDEGDKRGATESKLFEKLKKKIEPWPWAQNKPYGCYVVCCVL